ncbi:hypothetical protein B0H17DRAFT_1132017 [Mycena rosella]|uniref:Uncharacterized protein n=1 Tax=Mycena rosella TaxID=1033263 RepID=A0AAD7GJZ0_MYCRO|nr:hypothetical protein B0H17DRAFT_1132017 [Mycena rosella]
MVECNSERDPAWRRAGVEVLKCCDGFLEPTWLCNDDDSGSVLVTLGDWSCLDCLPLRKQVGNEGQFKVNSSVAPQTYESLYSIEGRPRFEERVVAEVGNWYRVFPQLLDREDSVALASSTGRQVLDVGPVAGIQRRGWSSSWREDDVTGWVYLPDEVCNRRGINGDSTREDRGASNGLRGRRHLSPPPRSGKDLSLARLLDARWIRDAPEVLADTVCGDSAGLAILKGLNSGGGRQDSMVVIQLPMSLCGTCPSRQRYARVVGVMDRGSSEIPNGPRTVDSTAPSEVKVWDDDIVARDERCDSRRKCIDCPSSGEVRRSDSRRLKDYNKRLERVALVPMWAPTDRALWAL